MINLGTKTVSAVYAGTKLVSAVYQGSVKVWPTDTTPPGPTYVFFDDFERATIGTAWTGSGALIESGVLKKNTAAGSADIWTAQSFATDDIDVTAILGPIQDSQQKAAILIGSTAQNVYLEFSKTSGVLGAYNGTTWTTLSNFGGLAWAPGDEVRLVRSGTTITAYRNGSVIATGTSSVARGTAYRKVALSVKMAINFVRFYGPTFDSVGINRLT